MSILFKRTSFGALALLVAFASTPFHPETAAAAKSSIGAQNSMRAKTDDKKQHQPGRPEHAGQKSQKPADKPNRTTASRSEQSPAQKVDPATSTVTAVQARTTPAKSTKSNDPAGNNGTIKIDALPFDNHPNNQPHVTCTFQVDFYGYDRGDYNANVNFALHAPTKNGRTLSVVSGDLTPFIGEDAASGGTDLDSSETYQLAFTGDPHPKQGYHVKVTVHAPFSQGNDTKTKVFWVQPCVPEQPDKDGGDVGGDTDTTKPDQLSGGQLLGEAASITRQLPAELPATGNTSQYFVMYTLLAMAMTYGAVYFMQNRRVTDN